MHRRARSTSGSLAARGPNASQRAKSLMLAGRTKLANKFPIHPECGGNNFPAIDAFKMLCPSYARQIEADAEADE